MPAWTTRIREITLELHATGKGLMPSLDKLVNVKIPGFKITKKDDQGLSIARVESGATSVNAVSEQTWLLTLKPNDERRRVAYVQVPGDNRLGHQVSF